MSALINTCAKTVRTDFLIPEKDFIVVQVGLIACAQHSLLSDVYAMRIRNLATLEIRNREVADFPSPQIVHSLILLQW
jgi:hypothetical protein